MGSTRGSWPEFSRVGYEAQEEAGPSPDPTWWLWSLMASEGQRVLGLGTGHPGFI